jgi:hypothetical protein
MVRCYSVTVGLFIREDLIMYYCNGFWFDQYAEARRYADFLLNHARVYRSIFTRSEMEAHFSEAIQ